MLKAAKPLSSPALIPFVPRPVVLENRRSTAAAAAAEEEEEEQEQKKGRKIGAPAIVSFVARPVLLENCRSMTVEKEEKKGRKEKGMEKEKKKIKKKIKKKTNSSETLEDGSADVGTLALDRANGGGLPQKGKGREVLLRSIALFLESNGFARTLSVFQSEAQLESKGQAASFINLEDLFCKFLESSEAHTHGSLDLQKEKDLENISTKESIHDASGHIHRKKRKHGNGADEETKAKEKESSKSATECCSTGNTEVFGDKTLIDKEKRKKMHKKTDNCDENTEHGNHEQFREIAEEKIEQLNFFTNNSISAETNGKNKCEKKKKKDKSTSVSLNESDKLDQVTSHDGKGSAKEDLSKSDEILEEKEEELKSLNNNSILSAEPNGKNKGEKKKKKKDQSTSENLDVVGSDQLDQETSHDGKGSAKEELGESDKIAKEKIEELKSLTNKSILSDEPNGKNKGEKKRKKDKSTSENLDAVRSSQLDQETSHVGKGSAKEDLSRSDFGKENVTVSKENVDKFEKKSSKKRKRSTLEERVPEPEKEPLTKESKHASLEGAEDNQDTGTLQKPPKSLPDGDCPTLGKKRKTVIGNESSTQALVMSPSNQNSAAVDSQKQMEGHKLANWNPEENGKEGGVTSNGKKKEKQSSESKPKNAFQRVKVDQVKFVDERLQDNSYWALDDTGSGYGAKAQEVLGQVRGRDFRHEKTKKKRGTYRGGQIDLHSHSIKFNYSDDE